MIRLTELEHRGTRVELRLEGELDQEALGVLARTFAEYGHKGVQEMHLAVNGLQPVLPAALKELAYLSAGHPSAHFHSSSPFLQVLLRSYGMEVEGSHV